MKTITVQVNVPDSHFTDTLTFLKYLRMFMISKVESMEVVDPTSNVPTTLETKKVFRSSADLHAKQLVSEFHERIKFAMSKTVCDIPQTEEALLELYDGYDPGNQRELVLILYKEIQQLIAAVRDCK